MKRPSIRDERGETLLEILVAITILAVCIGALSTAIALGVMTSGAHRSQSLANDFLHNYAEKLDGSTYTPCTAGSTPNYVAALTAPGAPGLPSSNWSLSAQVTYWTGSAFGAASTCPAAGDPGLQKVTLSLDLPGQRVTETLVVVLRNPA